MQIRYELKTIETSTFWEIQVERKSYTIRSGKIGDEGCVRKETCSSKEEAQKEANIAAAEKVGDGYVLIPGNNRAIGGLARRAANLRKKLTLTPENIVGWVDYGYFLQSLHEPHGVQITTLGDQLINNPDSEELQEKWSELLAKYSDHWIDELLIRGIDEDWSVTVDLEWKSGYISQAKLITELSKTLRTKELLQALLSSPLSLFLRDISLGVYEIFGDDLHDWFRYQDCIDTLANAAPRPFIRNLYIGESDANTSSMQIGDVSGLYTVMPNLEVLKICGNYITLGKLQLKKLKRLDVLTVGLGSAQVRSIANAILPELQTLNVWVGDASNGAVQTFDELKPLLRLEQFPKLKHLFIGNSEFEDEIVQEILSSPLLSQLESLSFRMGIMTNRGARALLAAAGALQHVESIDVGENCIEEELVAELKAVFPNKIQSSGQKDFDYYYDYDGSEFDSEDEWIEHELSENGDGSYVTIYE